MSHGHWLVCSHAATISSDSTGFSANVIALLPAEHQFVMAQTTPPEQDSFGSLKRDPTGPVSCMLCRVGSGLSEELSRTACVSRALILHLSLNRASTLGAS